MSELYREIRKNRIILEGRKPWKETARETFDEWGLHQFVYSCIHLDGRNLSREDVKTILMGNVVPKATLADYARVQGLETAALYLNRLCLERIPEYTVRLHLRKEPWEKLPTEAEFCLMWCFLEGMSEEKARTVWKERTFFRKFSPVVQAISHVPCHFSELPEKTEKLFRWAVSTAKDPNVNPVLFATEFHNRMLELYPYESENEDMAKLAAESVLLAFDLPLVPWSMTEPEYYGAMRDYLDSVETGAMDEDGYPRGTMNLYGRLEKLVYQTQGVLIRLTNPEEEPEEE